MPEGTGSVFEITTRFRVWHNASRMPYFLGIDSGGTKTSVAVGDNDRLLAQVTEGGASPTRYDTATVRRTLHAGIEAACFKAGISPAEITYSCIGSAGVSVESQKMFVESTIGEIVGGQIMVVGDMLVAHEAAFFGAPGVAVIAGTGSIAVGINDRGEIARAGGWGPSTSDEGSGTWIGRKAVSGLLRALDAGDTTALANSIMETWHVRTHQELVAKCNTASHNDFARLFPAVQLAAGEGDVIARDIMTQAGMELATLGKMVARRLWTRQQRVCVAMAGGIFQHSATIRQAFYHYTKAERADALLRLSTIPPVFGALALARRLSSCGTDTQLRIKYEE